MKESILKPVHLVSESKLHVLNDYLEINSDRLSLCYEVLLSTFDFFNCGRYHNAISILETNLIIAKNYGDMTQTRSFCSKCQSDIINTINSVVETFKVIPE